MAAPTTDPRRPARPRRRNGARRVLRAALVCLVVLVLLAGGSLWWAERELFGQIDRLQGAFDGLGPRPQHPGSGPGADALNVLVLVPRGHGATILLVHVDGSRRAAAVIAFPRRVLLDVPGGAPRTARALSESSPAAVVAAVEATTQVRVDHVAVLAWPALEQLAADVGVPDGGAGGPAPVRRQADFLRSLATEALSQELRREPLHVVGLVHTLTRHLSLDDGWGRWELVRLAASLRSLRSAAISFLLVPVTRSRRADGRARVVLDVPTEAGLWAAVRQDAVTDLARRDPALEAPTPARR